MFGSHMFFHILYYAVLYCFMLLPYKACFIDPSSFSSVNFGNYVHNICTIVRIKHLRLFDDPKTPTLIWLDTLKYTVITYWRRHLKQTSCSSMKNET